MIVTKKNRTILNYPAIFEPAIEGGFNVSFPDFPGCVTFGDSYEDAKDMAKEALELWLEVLASEGRKIFGRYKRPLIDDVSVVIPDKAKIQYETTNG